MIAGIRDSSLIDYPGKTAVVLCTSQCNFRCPFCYNRQLALGEHRILLSEQQVLEMLVARRDGIGGVVITGGEPTVEKKLFGFIAVIKALKFSVKLETNGYNPGMLRMLFAYGGLDFVTMDIKTTWPKYSRAAGIAVDIKRLMESIDLIKSSGVAYEFCTTCVPTLVDSDDIVEISRLVGKAGQYALQQFQPENTLDPEYKTITPYSRETLMRLLEIAHQNVASCRLIGIPQTGGGNDNGSRPTCGMDAKA